MEINLEMFDHKMKSVTAALEEFKDLKNLAKETGSVLDGLKSYIFDQLDASYLPKLNVMFIIESDFRRKNDQNDA